MTREIKFKMWDVEEKCWLEDFYKHLLDGYTKTEEEGNILEIFSSDNSFAICQFTGLLDKKGKEIFEGDIVTWSDGKYKHPSNPRVAEVRFDPELSFFAFNVDVDRGGHKFGYSNFIYSDTENHLEVIGNIYQNPELKN